MFTHCYFFSSLLQLLPLQAPAAVVGVGATEVEAAVHHYLAVEAPQAHGTTLNGTMQHGDRKNEFKG